MKRNNSELMTADDNEVFEKCLFFLKDIGIKIQFRELQEGTLLPGFEIEGGVLCINRDSVLYPGDILHEAGHIAVVPSAERETLFNANIDKRKEREAEEMMAIAWSYAACIYLNIDPHFVFHDNGYKGGGSYIADNFKEKRYFGLPMLQWIGLTHDEKNAEEKGAVAYPVMIKWLRD